MTTTTLTLVEELEGELLANSFKAHELERRKHLLRYALTLLHMGEDEVYVQAWLQKQERAWLESREEKA